MRKCCEQATAYEEFTAVKRSYAKTGGIEAYHGYLSFKEQDITPELSLKIGTEFAQEVWGNRFQVLVTVHTDTDHERADLRKYARRKISADELKETKDKITHITTNLRKLRHELKLCEHIAEQSKAMEQGLETVLNDEQKARAKNKSRGYER